MIYDSMSGALYGDDGAFLKTVYCPMTIRLEELAKIAPDSPDRKCHACGDVVHSLDDMSEHDAARLIASNPRACVFATPKAKSVVFLKPIGWKDSAPANTLRIKTARNLQTMSDAQKRGFRLVIKDTGVVNEFGSFKFQLLENTETGELEWSGDFRDLSTGGAGWSLVKAFTSVRPDRPFPIAAYLIPPGLLAGTHVYVEDLIQDVQQVIWNQGETARVTATTGTWNGQDIDLDDRSNDAIMMG